MNNEDQGNMSSLSSQPNDSQSAGNLGTPPPAVDAPQATPSDDSNNNVSPELQDIKNQAVSELIPLVKNLNQSPEDQFKTLLLLIQSTDNQDLIKDAYDAAQKITDNGAKAEALLDIVNEINYFSLPPE